MEKEIIQLIGENGPLTGAEIWEALGGDGLILWRTCSLSESLAIRTVGRRYMRLDRRVNGYARLSPSILREFLTYSVVGLLGEETLMAHKASGVISQIEEISRSKLDLAYRIVSSLTDRLDSELSLEQGACFIIAGDIVYEMAHNVPRAERSTGKMVAGSDMDLVVVVEDSLPERWMKRLDAAIYQEKYRLLMTPHLKEEIDYVVKRLRRVKEQVNFKTFKDRVACKILQEGILLYGSEGLFSEIKTMLLEKDVSGRLKRMEKRAAVFREGAEDYLLSVDPGQIKEEDLFLFYPAEESEEFE